MKTMRSGTSEKENLAKRMALIAHEPRKSQQPLRFAIAKVLRVVLELPGKHVSKRCVT
jgi:hypothetical protein